MTSSQQHNKYWQSPGQQGEAWRVVPYKVEMGIDFHVFSKLVMQEQALSGWYRQPDPWGRKPNQTLNPPPVLARKKEKEKEKISVNILHKENRMK